MCSNANADPQCQLFIIIIITDLYSAFMSEDTEALEAAQEPK